MSGPQLPHPLSEAASSVVCRIPELHRLRDLENEEAQLDAKARQLMEQPPQTKNRPSTPSHLIISTPVSKLRSRATENAVDAGFSSTPPYIGPRNVGTPVKTFLLTESFALAMSVKSKRKGRIFMAGGSTEFGERR